QLLEKDPARRPGSAAEVAATLRAIETSPAPSGDTFTPPAINPEPAPPPSAGSARARPSSSVVRRRWLFAGAGLALVLLGGGIAWWGVTCPAPEPDGKASVAVPRPSGPPLRLGVLYSRTGTMAISERSVLDGVLLAMDEINERGGVLGRPVEAVIEDG